VNGPTISVGRAQILLGRLIGLSIAIALFFALAYTLEGSASQIPDLLPIMLLLTLPPAATLGLLFAGQRRIAGYVSLLGIVPCIAMLLIMFISSATFGWSLIWLLQNTLLSLPFFYTAITLARVGVGVRVTSGERRQARQLRAVRRAATLAIGSATEQGTLRVDLPDAGSRHHPL
jgi:hypothetical protein